MKSLLHTAALCVGLLIAPASVLAAPDADAKPDPKDDKTEAPALPADASARQSMRLAYRTLTTPPPSAPCRYAMPRAR